MSEAILSKWVHKKNDSGVSDSDFLKILDEPLLNLGKNCLISYSKSYQENPKAFISSFIKYDSIKLTCQYVIKYARRSGILEELKGQKDFSEWVSKQRIEGKWKPVLSELLLIIWGTTKDENQI